MGGGEFLSAHLPTVITATTDLLNTDDDYQHRAVMRIIEQLLIRFPKEVGHLLQPMYEHLFIFLLKEKDEPQTVRTSPLLLLYFPLSSYFGVVC